MFMVIGYHAFSQHKDSLKVIDVFMAFIEKKLPLTSQESILMRPLVVHYFNDTKKNQRQNTDPLIREQQKVDIKIKYRDLFQPIIGTDRSNRFFVEEQLFRKRVRDELKQRRNQ